MRYLFFDLEYATSKKTIKICEFGYVITNENFEVSERNNLIINPNIERSEWDYWALQHILTRKIKDYEERLTFPYYYEKVKQVFKGVDYVFGHSLSGDFKALNDDCKRYELASFNYEFYDVKQFYKDFSNKQKDTSVVNMMQELNVCNGDNNTHDAEADAYNTMLELKAMISSLNCSIKELIELCPSAKDFNKDYVVNSIEENRLKREAEFLECIDGDGSNDIKRYSDNKKRYLQFLDNVKPQRQGKKFINKKISISLNYEEHHYRQTLNLVQLIIDEGGSVVLKASLADIFVKFDVYNEDGTLRKDSKLRYVEEANGSGASIEIIDFEEFLNRLSISEEELNNMPMVSFDCLFSEEAIIKDKRDAKAIKKKSEIKSYFEGDGTVSIADILKMQKNK